jgi:hypothetical protein
MNVPRGVVGPVGQPPDKAEGGRRAGAVMLGAVLGGGEDVLGLLDCLDLRDDDAGSCVKGVTNGCVVVAGDAGWSVGVSFLSCHSESV